MAFIYLDSKTKVWYEELLCEREYVIEKEEFTKAFCIKFGNTKDVEEFNKLVQEKRVNKYGKRFGELKSLTLCLIHPYQKLITFQVS
jgi:hypothetical protein